MSCEVICSKECNHNIWGSICVSVFLAWMHCDITAHTPSCCRICWQHTVHEPFSLAFLIQAILRWPQRAIELCFAVATCRWNLEQLSVVSPLVLSDLELSSYQHPEGVYKRIWWEWLQIMSSSTTTLILKVSHISAPNLIRSSCQCQCNNPVKLFVAQFFLVACSAHISQSICQKFYCTNRLPISTDSTLSIRSCTMMIATWICASIIYAQSTHTVCMSVARQALTCLQGEMISMLLGSQK